MPKEKTPPLSLSKTFLARPRNSDLYHTLFWCSSGAAVGLPPLHTAVITSMAFLTSYALRVSPTRWNKLLKEKHITPEKTPFVYWLPLTIATSYGFLSAYFKNKFNSSLPDTALAQNIYFASWKTYFLYHATSLLSFGLFEQLALPIEDFFKSIFTGKAMSKRSQASFSTDIATQLEYYIEPQSHEPYGFSQAFERKLAFLDLNQPTYAHPQLFSQRDVREFFFERYASLQYDSFEAKLLAALHARHIQHPSVNQRWLDVLEAIDEDSFEQISPRVRQQRIVYSKQKKEFLLARKNFSEEYFSDALALEKNLFFSENLFPPITVPIYTGEVLQTYYAHPVYLDALTSCSPKKRLKLLHLSLGHVRTLAETIGGDTNFSKRSLLDLGEKHLAHPHTTAPSYLDTLEASVSFIQEEQFTWNVVNTDSHTQNFLLAPGNRFGAIDAVENKGRVHIFADVYNHLEHRQDFFASFEERLPLLRAHAKEYQYPQDTNSLAQAYLHQGFLRQDAWFRAWQGLHVNSPFLLDQIDQGVRVYTQIEAHPEVSPSTKKLALERIAASEFLYQMAR